MIMSPNTFEGLCLRFKAGDDAAAVKEPDMEGAAEHEAAEEAPAVTAPQTAVAQDSTSVPEEQICISTGMSSGRVSLSSGDT